MAKSRRNLKGLIGIRSLIILFLMASVVCLSIGAWGLFASTETFVYAIQNLAFGAVLIVSAYSLHKGTRRVWWLAIVLYILMGIVISAYFAYAQGQILSLIKIPVYIVILAYMMGSRMKNWFGI